MIRKHVLAEGLVQGVFFRDSCRRVACRHAVRGWVRNLPDGRVEAVFEGDPEGVAQLVSWARTGPTGARVDNLEVHEEPAEGFDAFTIR
ncbi:acylphosphatase [Actinoplanes lobatus]|uniref:acylphosphatase n=1 Tax=Actinoplanes lobatus TaxID=113568 RepID=A0A7W7HRD8_9ACTN|nr:acylphosphatase [Actinoplanes lobatus]MBB4755244.1 acylphosphatase [Actinoplanes lobatus]GGN88660.1 acylphosphatase [Actinoplanes lobatus]GIE43450.1 acylphosphatase [Actinoplanes lobatus]